MIWVAPSEKDIARDALEKRLWAAANQFRANSGLSVAQYSQLVLCLSYYDTTGRFDFVLANPPFNVNAVDKERLKDSVGLGRRFPFGLPRTDNGNYLWIQLFYSAPNPKGRAGFVMANGARRGHSCSVKFSEEGKSVTRSRKN